MWDSSHRSHQQSQQKDSSLTSFPSPLSSPGAPPRTGSSRASSQKSSGQPQSSSRCSLVGRDPDHVQALSRAALQSSSADLPPDLQFARLFGLQKRELSSNQNKSELAGISVPSKVLRVGREWQRGRAPSRDDMVTLRQRARRAVSLASAKQVTGRGARGGESKAEPKSSVSAGGRVLRARGAGVTKASRPSSAKKATRQATAEKANPACPDLKTPVKGASKPLTIARGSTPLRVYSPRGRKSPKSSGSVAKKASRRSARAQNKVRAEGKEAKTPETAKKRVTTFAEASPSSQVPSPGLEQYLSEMKAYFADVDAYELQEA